MAVVVILNRHIPTCTYMYIPYPLRGIPDPHELPANANAKLPLLRLFSSNETSLSSLLKPLNCKVANADQGTSNRRQ